MAFDYVIVGAGSAGCVLAEALSRDGRFRVAIIEAGGSDRKFFVQMPLGYGKTFYDRSINWNYFAEPDPGLNGQRDYWPRGRIIGGSGSLNAMVWIRGDARDYDGWEAEGNPGWGWRDVLPVFRALEHCEEGEERWRGRGGPVHITDQTAFQHPLTERFIRAGVEAGFPFNPDFNGARQEGVGLYQTNTKGGWRMSAARAFLYPALKRPNLTLITNAQVTRILFRGDRATGVEIARGRSREELNARREVVLAAGAINSPQLLQLSGIGPAEHLRPLGVDVRVDSPAVGQHMQDHLGINYVFRAKVPSLNEVLRPFWRRMGAGAQFLLARSGPLSMSLNQGGGFVRSRPWLDRPDTQLYMQAISTFTARTGTRPLLMPDPFPGYAIGMSSCRPEARGSCLIRSADPFEAPMIRPNAYGTDNDVQTMLSGVKVIRRIAEQAALAEVTEVELAPGPKVVSDEALIEDFRNRSGTVYHPCGSARMAPDIGDGAVDHRLRVHGVTGLRVADASVFPSVISGNINAPVMMVASKGATMIVEDAE